MVSEGAEMVSIRGRKVGELAYNVVTRRII